MLRIDFEREEDGRWIAEIEALPGVMAYGATRAEARPNYVSAFHDREEIGPKMLSRIGKSTGLTPDDL
jgi:hypothetical protein